MYIDIIDLEPVKFHPYTSRTLRRIFSVDNYGDDFRLLKRELIEYFKREGIKAWNDNKIVFEMKKEDETKIYYGFYDGVFTIGLDYFDENEK